MSESPDIEAIAKRLVIGHKRDGRSIYDATAKAELVAACAQPGVSLARVARLCGINANVLSHWVRQQQRTPARVPPEQPAAGEVLEIAAQQPFVELQLPAPPLAPAAPTAAAPLVDLQARLPNGVLLDLRLADVAQAVQLIESLGRLRCSASTRP